jgi:hypothetical protein
MGRPEVPEEFERAVAVQTEWQNLLLRSVNEPDFRQQLLARPMEVLREAGIELEGVDEVVILEFDPARPILVLPPMGAEIAPTLPPELGEIKAAPSG